MSVIGAVQSPKNTKYDARHVDVVPYLMSLQHSYYKPIS